MEYEIQSSRKVLARVLDLPENQIPDGASIDSFDEWTSLGHFRLVKDIEEIVGRKLVSMEILELIDLEGIARVLSR